MTNTSKLPARLAFLPTSLLFFIATITFLPNSKLSAQVVITPTTTDALCAGSCDGAIDLKVSGGTAPYTYTWASSVAGTGYQTINLCEAATPTNCANYTITDIAVKLCPGTYTVTVTDNAGLTKTSVNTVAIQPSNKLQVVTDASTTTCVAGCTGIIKVNPSGGNAPYTYSWSGSAVTGDTRNGLCGGVSPVGDYTVKVTDAAGCDSILTYHIGPTPSPTINGAPICAGTSTTLTATGGGTYTWSANAGGVNTVSVSVNPVVNTTYTVTVSNAGCPDATATYALVVNPAVTATTTPTDILCNGKNTGSIVVSPTTGTAPYTYAWTGSGPNSPTNSNLIAGGYTVTITDNKGCTTTATANLTEPTPIVVTPTTVKPACNGSTGSATVSGSGGTSPYSYVWSNAATGATISGVPADSYTVTVTDNNGCTQTDVIPISNNPSPTISSITGTPPLCNGNANGTTTVVASGGTGTLTYNWSSGSTTTGATGLTGSTYVVTVTDANNCKEISTVTITDPPVLATTASAVDANCGNADGSVSASPTGGTGAYTYSWANGGATGQTVSSLLAGTYTVTVTDNNGCTTSSTATIGTQVTGTASVTKTDVKCNGGVDGSVVATLTGGTATAYTWSSGGTAQTESGRSAGTYTVTITDANGCTSTSTATITEPTAVTAATTSTTAICTAANGTATVTPGGGTTPYQYLWSNSSTIAAPTGLTAATYIVTVTDFNGCTATSTVAVGAVNGSGTATASVVNNVLCFGESTGTLTVTMTAGTSPFTYNWSPLGGTGQTTVGLNARDYTVTVTDANGCQVTSSATLNDPPVLTAFTTPTDATCGQSNGSATVTANGGTGTLTYAWPAPGGQTGTSATLLSAGSYVVTITDANSCTKTATAIINNAGGAIATTSVNNDVTCFGGTNGSATVSMANASTYTWQHGPTTATVSNLAMGTYTVTVKDANGCESVSTVDITEPPAIVPVTSHTNAPCGSLTGSVSVTSTGGTGASTFTWSSPGAGNNATMSGIGVGTYTVTVTDASGCTKTAEESVSNVPGPTVTLTGTNLMCNGAATGTISVVATGGTGTLTYVWSTGTATGATSVTGLSAGNYQVSVTDAGGCTGVSNVTITQPSPIAATFASTDATCGSSNGTLTVTPSGGASPYTYVWFDSSTGQTVSSLSSGGYAVTITDASGCTHDTSGTVNPAGGGIASITLGSNVSCFGKNDGSATASIVGGAPNYTYTWSHGPTTTTVSNLAGGTYSVTVIDANGCSSISSVIVNEPTAITNQIDKTDATCGQTNGTAYVSNVSGGTGGYQFLWNYQSATSQIISGLAPNAYGVLITDANGCTKTSVITVSNVPGPTIDGTIANDLACNGDKSGSATVSISASGLRIKWSSNPATDTLTSISGLSANIYAVTVTDANGCSTVSTVAINEPPAIAAPITTVDASCGQSNGSATVTGSGGTAPLTYVWSNGSTTFTGDTYSGLVANTYTLVVTDDNGCTMSTTTTINNSGGPIVSSITPTNILCNGSSTGTATVTLTTGAGTAPYTYSWSNGTTGVTTDLTHTISSLVADTFSVTVKDANGCQVVTSVIVTEPAPLGVPTFSTSNAACGKNNGSATASSTGGTPPLVYMWNDGSATIGATASNLPTGTYIVTVTDANSCSKTASVNVGTSNGPKATLAGTNMLCNIGNTGTASVTVTSGTAPFTYSWSTGVTAVTSINNLYADTIYKVTVTDSKGCSSTSTVVLGKPAALMVTTKPTDAICGTNNGTVTATVTGGSSLYTYSWSNGKNSSTSVTNDSIAMVAAGTYTVIVSDANGCTASSDTIVKSKSKTVLTVIPAQQTITQGGSVTIVVVGAVTYTWSPAEGLSCTDCPNPTATPTVTTTYTIVATDAYGCTAVAFMTVTVRKDCSENEADIFIANVFSPNDDGMNDKLYVQGNGLTDIYWAIYDRWGNLLYEAFDQVHPWDGTRRGRPMEAGTYVYYLKATCIKTGDKVVLKGNVSIVQ